MSNACLLENWVQEYSSKILTAEEAVDRIPSGSRILIGSGAAVPVVLAKALADPAHGPGDAEILHLLTLGPAPYSAPELMSRYRTNALFIGPNVRRAVNEGRADYTPIHLHEVPSLLRPGGNLPLDAALVQVTPPDRSGFVSLGVSVDVVKAAIENAPLVIAEINPNMPRTHGDSFVSIERIDWLVPVDHPIPELGTPPPGKVEMAIGRNVAELVQDGDTIQLGIGKIPDAVLQALDGKKHLGIHSEMVSDGVMDLIRKGVIDNSRKTYRHGKVVVSFAMGSAALYEFLDDNPLFDFRPVDFTNNPVNIARNHHMISINSALQVDLTGQVCADSTGYRFYSGVGGQVDFFRGAAMSEGGKAIIAMPSTARGGTISRIVPHLEEGAGVVTTRADVHYIVTEFGVAHLHGRNIRERVLQLIDIAHPKFRDALIQEARQRAYLYKDQAMTPLLVEYPQDFVHTEVLRDGTKLRFRPIRASDEPQLREMFHHCSPETVHRRFASTVRSIPHANLQRFLNVDYRESFAQVAEVGEPGKARMVALGEYRSASNNSFADVAFTVEDEFQHRGIGTLLLADLVRAARKNRLKGLTAVVHVQNAPMLKVFHRCGFPVESLLADGQYSLRIPFDEEPSGPAGG